MPSEQTRRSDRKPDGRSRPFLHTIKATNILSFGPETQELSLQPLNVLVGPNGAGKSNLLELLALLRASATSLRDVIAQGGGAGEWIWKGERHSAATLDVVLSVPPSKELLRHVLSFKAAQQGFGIHEERIEYHRPGPGHPKPYSLYSLQEGRATIDLSDRGQRQLTRDSIDPDRSIVAQRRDPESYPEITSLGEAYERIRLYREWAFSRHSVVRQPQKADLRTDRLEEDFSNLGLFLNRFKRNPTAKRAVLDALRDLYEGLSDFDVSVEAGTVQVFFTEGDFTIPATRLSDGTLRYLCFLAILCDPDPPPLVAIEEPELGLHPDLLPKIADLLIDASKRTQIIATTHSDILIDALTEHPDTVVIVEKHAGQTSMKRLDAQSLASWLQKYRLGQLWTRGDLGGTRW